MPIQARVLRFNRKAVLESIEETIRKGPYLADLFINQRCQPSLFIFIITRKGSNKILDWGRSFSMPALREHAEQSLSMYSENVLDTKPRKPSPDRNAHYSHPKRSMR